MKEFTYTVVTIFAVLVILPSMCVLGGFYLAAYLAT